MRIEIENNSSVKIFRNIPGNYIFQLQDCIFKITLPLNSLDLKIKQEKQIDLI